MHVVTGASSGIGRGLTHALVERGETVIGVARSPEGLAALPEGVHTVPADVTTDDGRAAVVEAVAGRPLSSLTHGAGSIVPVEPWSGIDPDEITEHFRVHVAAPIAVTAALLEAGSVERVVVLDSYAATTPRHGWSAYAVLKAAAQMSARGAGLELGSTVVARIYPGAVNSPLLRTILEGPDDVPAVSVYRGLADDGRVSEPLDIGHQIADLLCDLTVEELAAQEVWHVGHPA